MFKKYKTIKENCCYLYVICYLYLYNPRRFVLLPTPFSAKILGPPPFPSILKKLTPPIYEEMSSSYGIEILI